jgi:uncharacterized protein DUF6572
VDRISREQMVSEFGAPGVQNPQVLDLITTDPATGDVVLVMFERRPWGADPRQFAQIEDKINRYMAYALDGFLAEHHPQHIGKRVQIRLECAEPPTGEAAVFLAAAGRAAREHGLELTAVVGTGSGG